MKKTSVDFKKMALEVFRGVPVDLETHGVVYRKGKTAADIVAARSKALNPRYGQAKTETELSWLALFLNDVFKAAPIQALTL